MIALLPAQALSITNQVVQYGVWAYLLIFAVILFASTIVGGYLPDSTFLFLIGATALDKGLSIELLYAAAVAGAFLGYEINYWSGREFGLTACRGACPIILQDQNVRKALDMMERFGPVSLIFSRFMPVMNLPSFIAGLDGMEYHRYAVFNFVSSVVWCGGLLILGYYIGSIGVIDAILDPLVNLVFIVMIIAIIIVLALFVRDYVRHKNTPLPVDH
jgi:membrane-associated protein